MKKAKYISPQSREMKLNISSNLLVESQSTDDAPEQSGVNFDAKEDAWYYEW